MRLRLKQLQLKWLLAAIVLLAGALSASPLWAQISDRQVNALVEALRQAAPRTGRQNDGLYSDWQIMPSNIPRWTRLCLGRQLSPDEFEANPNTARQVVACVMKDVLNDEYGKSGNSESIAVRRAAAWWMTGNPDRYNSGDTAAYTQRVLNAYQQQSGTAAAQPAPSPANSQPAPNPAPSPSNSQPAPSPSAQPTQAAPAGSSPVFDRYMRAGYSAVQKKDYATALLYFQRALDERPNDPYAQRAIDNVQRYRNSAQPVQSTPQASPQASPQPASSP